MRPAYADRHNFDTPQAAAEKCAMRIAAELSLAIHERGRAVLAAAVSPDAQPLWAVLSQADIPWNAVTVSLIDECTAKPRAYEALLRLRLLQNRASAARFLGLYVEARTTELAAFSASARINRLSRPFDCVVLNMDAYGQTAGFFKGSSRLKALLDMQSRALVLPNYVKAQYGNGAGETHLAVTLPLIAEAGLIVLPISGKEKLLALEESLQDGAAEDMPIRAVLREAKYPAQIYWSDA